MTTKPAATGDALPPACQVIEVRVKELWQLFNAMDPSPFRQRDLDPGAAEFITDWSRELSSETPIGLVVHLERAAGGEDEGEVLREAIHEFFAQRAAASRKRLRQLFGRGRISLLIALAFLAVATGIGDALATYYQQSRVAALVREGLLIGGWVAMWRPLEVFLYDWWPIRAEARLFDRLSGMPVRIEYAETEPTEDWRSDWPAAPAAVPVATATSQARRFVAHPQGGMLRGRTTEQP
jgi:hypothetical protein